MRSLHGQRGDKQGDSTPSVHINRVAKQRNSPQYFNFLPDLDTVDPKSPDPNGSRSATLVFSITTARAAAVEFSMPWMNLGISIIYQKPKEYSQNQICNAVNFTNENLHMNMVFHCLNKKPNAISRLLQKKVISRKQINHQYGYNKVSNYFLSFCLFGFISFEPK